MKAILNETNEQNEKVIHLMITDLCDRRCPLCCNNQYELTDIPIVTDEEFQKAERIYLTGGEPFAYGKPNMVAKELKEEYPNISRIVVYTNALELAIYLLKGGAVDFIDGVTVSLKDKRDREAFDRVIANHPEICKLRYNRLYVFKEVDYPICPRGFEKRDREWQKVFVAAPNSIFRRIKF